MGGFQPRLLGKTGLTVSPIGFGGGYGMTSADLLYAFDCGINYFFFSSDLHHFAYQRSVDALRTLCGSGSALRNRVVLATVSYINDPEKLHAVLLDQFQELGTDYIDVFHWGWVTEKNDCEKLFGRAGELKQEGLLTYILRVSLDLKQRMAEANEQLIRSGLVRNVGASFHAPELACRWLHDLDVLMLRYDLFHPELEQIVFPMLLGTKQDDPGIVVFNVAHAIKRLPKDQSQDIQSHQRLLTPSECYRWALAHPAVDLVLAGTKDRAELDAALTAIEQGPLSAPELARLESYRMHGVSERPI